MLSNGRTRGLGRYCFALSKCVSAYKGSKYAPEKFNISSFVVVELVVVVVVVVVVEEEEEEEEDEEEEDGIMADDGP